MCKEVWCDMFDVQLVDDGTDWISASTDLTFMAPLSKPFNYHIVTLCVLVVGAGILLIALVVLLIALQRRRRRHSYKVIPTEDHEEITTEDHEEITQS